MSDFRIFCCAMLVGIVVEFVVVSPKASEWPLPLVYVFSGGLIAGLIGVAAFGRGKS